MTSVRLRLPPELTEDVDRRLRELAEQEVLPRIWRRDPTVWGDDPGEISDRLGWLDVAQAMRPRVDELRTFASRCAAEGMTSVVLAGMGGSSLAPEVLHAMLGSAPGMPELIVLDTTHPDTIAAMDRALDLDRTLFVVASKSGTTIETLSHLEHFWERNPRRDRFVAITDPATSLEETARERGFRATFLNPPDIGGRYSALSLFGLVPSALLGADLDGLLDGADAMARACAAEVPVDENPAALLGTAAATAALGGRDKLTYVAAQELAALGSWIEQLVAESTGKRGKGVLPVEGEEVGAPDVYGDDRFFVSAGAAVDALHERHPVVALNGRTDAFGLGSAFFLWELATAVAGAVLGINPFDQPNVQEAKDATAQALEQDLPPPGVPALEGLLDGLAPPDHLAILAYLPRDGETAARLQRVRMRLRDRLRVATTVGFGPRYLHSTGQLHKGGPATGVFVQVVDEPREDVAVPGKPYTFGRLIRAQADGDLRALLERRRRATRMTFEELESGT